MHFGRDASFTHEEFVNICNAELSNNMGNLYSRIVGMCRKNSENKVPVATNPGALENKLKEDALNLKSKQEEAATSWCPEKYIENIVEFANSVNKYIDETKPWSLAKDPTKKAELHTILRTSLEAVRIVFSYLWPITPKTSEKVLSELGASSSVYESATSWNILKDGASLPEKVTGFPRIEQ